MSLKGRIHTPRSTNVFRKASNTHVRSIELNDTDGLSRKQAVELRKKGTNRRDVVSKVAFSLFLFHRARFIVIDDSPFSLGA